MQKIHKNLLNRFWERSEKTILGSVWPNTPQFPENINFPNKSVSTTSIYYPELLFPLSEKTKEAFLKKSSKKKGFIGPSTENEESVKNK